MKNISCNAIKSYLAIAALVPFLAACANNGANLQSNVYRAGQVNTAQEVKVVTILSVTPAKIEVDNTQQKQGAQVIGGLLGAIGGGIAGNKIASKNNSGTGTVVGAVGGGVGGAALGSLVPDKTLVDGVSIAYKYNGKAYNSAQVGQLCEFNIGTDAMMVSTSPTETRIQPNATCPVK